MNSCRSATTRATGSSRLPSIHWPGLVLACVLTWLLGSCATPVMETRYDYWAPQDTSGQSCVNQCRTRQDACTEQCQSQQQSCLGGVSTRAEQLFPLRMAQYQAELARWRNRLDLKQRDERFDRRERQVLQQEITRLSLQCDHKGEDSQSCRSLDDARRRLDNLERYHGRPDAPEAPTLADLAQELSTACVLDCGCARRFRDCYASCGGVVQSRQVCVANCD